MNRVLQRISKAGMFVCLFRIFVRNFRQIVLCPPKNVGNKSFQIQIKTHIFFSKYRQRNNMHLTRKNPRQEQSLSRTVH